MKVLVFSLLVLSTAVAKGVVDGNGNFDFSKFFSTMIKKMNNTDAERSNGTKPNQTKLSQTDTVSISVSYEIIHIFEALDIDGDGFISAAEFLTVKFPEHIRPDEYEEFVEWMIKQFDFNADGQTDYEEFVLMVND